MNKTTCPNCRPMSYRTPANEIVGAPSRWSQWKLKMSNAKEKMLSKLSAVKSWIFENWIGIIIPSILISVLGLGVSESIHSSILRSQAEAADKLEFSPTDCYIEIKEGRYEIMSKGQNPKQSERIIGSTSDLKTSEALAQELRCQRLKSTTGGWRDLTN